MVFEKVLYPFQVFRLLVCMNYKFNDNASDLQNPKSEVFVLKF